MLYIKSSANVRTMEWRTEEQYFKSLSVHCKNDILWENIFDIMKRDNYAISEELLAESRSEPEQEQSSESNQLRNGNVDQDGQDLSDEEEYPLLNPNEIMPLMPQAPPTPHQIPPSYDEIQPEEAVQVAHDVEIPGNEVEIEGEPVIQIANESIGNDARNNNKKESEDSEREHSGNENSRSMEEEEETSRSIEEEKPEINEEDEQEQKQDQKENETLFTFSNVQAMMSPPRANANGTSAASLLVSPIKLMRHPSRSPEEILYYIKEKQRRPQLIIPPYQQQQTNEKQYPKPPYSYSILIMLALKNSFKKALQVCDIYSFICYHFPYFKTAPAGWKNSVRHNLSLNDRFHKIGGGGEDDENGDSPKSNTQKKGGLWTYVPEQTKKLIETMKSRSRKDPIGVTQSMAFPEMLESLECGEVTFVIGDPNKEYKEEDENEEEEEEEEEESDTETNEKESDGMELIASMTEAEIEEQNLTQEELASTQSYIEEKSYMRYNGYQDNHEGENGNTKPIIEAYEQIDAASLERHVYQHLQEVPPTPKRIRVNSSDLIQNGQAILQVQKNTIRRKITKKPQPKPQYKALESQLGLSSLQLEQIESQPGPSGLQSKPLESQPGSSGLQPKPFESQPGSSRLQLEPMELQSEQLISQCYQVIIDHHRF